VAKNLKLSKLLVFLVFCALLFTSCRSLPCRKCFERFPSKSEKVIKPFSSIDTVTYKVALDLYSMYFSGLLVIKRVAADHHKFALISETGFKLFDMEIIDGKAEIMNVFAELDRDAVKKTFKEDLTALVLSGFDQSECKSYGYKDQKEILFMCPEIKDIATFTQIDPKNGVVKKVWKAEDMDEEYLEINYGFEDNQFSKPKFITIIHFNVRLRIELTLLEDGNVQ
jgi:hypothetical protein